jgi:hypothetical protein
MSETASRMLAHVSPCLVGNVEHGIVEHDRYRVERKSS